MTDRPTIKDQALEEAMALQVIEGNPLDDAQVAMFAMFEREGWSQERRIAYIREKYTKTRVPNAAE